MYLFIYLLSKHSICLLHLMWQCIDLHYWCSMCFKGMKQIWCHFGGWFPVTSTEFASMMTSFLYDYVDNHTLLEVQHAPLSASVSYVIV